MLFPSSLHSWSLRHRVRLLLLLAAWWVSPFRGPVSADVAVPPQVLDPKSAEEAWNVLRLATANVDRLLRENRPVEIPPQISLCSPALRALPLHAKTEEARTQLKELIARGFTSINAIAKAGQAGDGTTAGANFAAFQTTLQEAAALFASAQVKSDIYVCPMHPDCLSANPATPCPKCGMHLLVRRIPYSFIYTRPGEPTVTLRATPAAPLEQGRPVQVDIELKTRDGAPVQPPDLTVMHTERIHLLIVDPSLEDYHHEHPAPTGQPGVYRFSFTPAKPGSYRIFADLVPMATGLQEYPYCDLAGQTPGTAVNPAASTFISETGGLRFELSFPELPGGSPRAGQIATMKLAVSEAGGKPVERLEPVMNAFAHAVGFYEDYLTVVHLHPTGGDILRQDLRGGPALGFKFFPPRPGFLRLYCQVLVDGKMLFAPFNVNVQP